MSIRTALVLVLGFVLLAGGALFFWPDLDNEPPASAQEVVESACTSLDKVDDYDVFATVKGSSSESPEHTVEGTYTFKAQVSGKEFHGQLLNSNGTGEEYKRVGDSYYAKDTYMGFDGLVTKGWQVHDGKIRHIDSWLSALGDEPICPDVSGVVFQAEEQLDGVKVSRYASGDVDGSQEKELDTTDDAFRGDKRVLFHQYWVNADGQLVQHRLEFFTLWQSPAGDVQWGSPELERQTSHGVMVMQFLEVGEPNTITAPVLGE